MEELSRFKPQGLASGRNTDDLGFRFDHRLDRAFIRF
jgi:hypothetical protein